MSSITQYAYDPFGNTAVSGATSANEFQYTGRENEGIGLYFYRARYYSPLLGRFVNEDPIGLGGGVNCYKYAGDNPISFYDPSGLDYSVSQTDGTTITVDVAITMYGAGANSALAGKWGQQISSMWNGHTWKGCNVVFNAVFTVDPKHESWLTATSSPGNNYVYVNQSYKASQTRTRAMLFTGYKFGDWWQDATRIEIVHDFGHLLDLDDEYDLKTGKPLPGFENDVMAMENEVSQFDLDNILAGRACGCQTKRNFHFGH